VISDVAGEGTPEVTTSLQPRVASAPRRGRHRDLGEAVTLQRASRRNNGIPRSTWYRSTRRISTWHRGYAFALVLLDFAAVAAASYTTVNRFTQADSGFQHSPEIFDLVAFVILPLAWVVVLWGHGAYDRRYYGVGTDEFKRVFRASLTITAIVSFLVFSTQFSPSRLTVGSTLLAGLVYVMVGRSLARRILMFLRGHGRAVHRVLLVGSYNESQEVLTAVGRVPGAGMIPVGVLLTEGYAAGRGARSPVPVFSGRETLSLVRELGADMIAVCGAASAEPGELRRLAWQIEGSGIDLVVAPQLTDIAGPRVHIRPVEGLPLLHVEEPKVSGVGWLVKNLFDRVAALLLLLVLSPLFLLVALIIRVSDPGPAFFRQTRVGREGQTFSVWKFRTMYVDAEERLAHLVDRNESNGLLFKIKDDPRITPFGRFLRRTSLDELPQLINVLLGEMSLVGPRPLPADDGDFLGDVRRRLLVRPGITGLWQVSGRSELSWEDAVRLDLYYVDNWSLAFDLVIMWRTIAVVFARKGAY
jgi:exopolysaccharide biosynthesis polyprenyl glycosylphosphotransferase